MKFSIKVCPEGWFERKVPRREKGSVRTAGRGAWRGAGAARGKGGWRREGASAGGRRSGALGARPAPPGSARRRLPLLLLHLRRLPKSPHGPCAGCRARQAPPRVPAPHPARPERARGGPGRRALTRGAGVAGARAARSGAFSLLVSRGLREMRASTTPTPQEPGNKDPFVPARSLSRGDRSPVGVVLEKGRRQVGAGTRPQPRTWEEGRTPTWCPAAQRQASAPGADGPLPAHLPSRVPAAAAGPPGAQIAAPSPGTRVL